MSRVISQGSLLRVLCLVFSSSIAAAAFAQSPVFTPGNLVVTVEGCGVNGGTCTNVTNGTGTGAGNSSNTGYGDNEAAPLTLFQYAPTGTSSVTFVNSLVLPQAASGANLPVSGEYGSSSEGMLQLDGTGRYLTVMGYGIDAPTFDNAYHPATAPGDYPTGSAATDPYGAAPSGALAQSGSLTGQYYTPIPRVIALIDAYGNVNSSSAEYNAYNTNNPRGVYSADGFNFYTSGQGSGCDLTGGVFLTTFGVVNNTPTAITGGDAAPTSSCVTSGYTGSTVAQDTRTIQIYNGTLYISVDSTEGKSDNRSYLGTLGTPPATSMYIPAAGTFPSGYTDGPSQISGIGNSGGTGKETLTAAQANGVNSSGLQVNLSPENHFFASPSVLYIADGGNPKQSSATSALGAGGLQKWVNSKSNGSGTWTWEYTLYKGLNLVANPTAVPANTDGTTGLVGLAGTVSSDGTTAYLYATNLNIADLDQTYLYGITDTLSTTANPGTSFTQLAAAPSDSNFKGVSFAPALPAGSATIVSSPSGLAFTTSGTGCAPGTYTTPVTLVWTPGASCQLSTESVQTAQGNDYALTDWVGNSSASSNVYNVTAPSTFAVYTADFAQAYLLTTSATTGGTVTPGGYVDAGTTTVITATPSTGYYFVNFTGSVTSTGNPLTLLVNGPQTITANFAPQVTATITFPTASAITYGQTLASSNLTGGLASTAGSFAFTNSSLVPTAGTDSESVTFTPTNTAEYTSVTSTVLVKVNQATPAITWPAPAAIPYGTHLSAAQLDASTTVPGSFTYTPAANTVLSLGTHTLYVTFNPADSTDYTSATDSVTLTVIRAPQTITFEPLASTAVFGAHPIHLSASSTSGLEVRFRVISGPAFVFGSELVIIGAGKVEVAAYQEGNRDYDPATTVTQSIVVSKATPHLTLDSSSSSIARGQRVTLKATLSGVWGSTPTGVVIFFDGSRLGEAGVDWFGGAAITIDSLSSKTNSITAVYGGDRNYDFATSDPITITVR